MIRELDSNPAHYADVIKADLHVDVTQVAGAGAAGGMGAALMAFLNAELRSGIVNRDPGAESGRAYPRLFAGGDR